MEKFIKNAVLLLFGFIIGSALVSAGLYILYKSIFINSTKTPPVISKQNIAIDNEYIIPQQYSPTNIIPQKDISTSIQSPLVVQGYKDHLGKTVSYINTLIIENNTHILPAMQNLPSRLSTGDWKTVFDEISKVKIKIEQIKTVSASLITELNALEETNQATKDAIIKNQTAAYVVASRQFVNTYSIYIGNLTDLLDGDVPNQTKLQSLNTTITILRKHTEELQKQGTLLFTSINKLESNK